MREIDRMLLEEVLQHTRAETPATAVVFPPAVVIAILLLGAALLAQAVVSGERTVVAGKAMPENGYLAP